MSSLKWIVLTAFVMLVALPAAQMLAKTSVDGSGTAVISDDQALSDAITYSLTGVAQPSSGRAYVGWLVSDDGTGKLSTGPITVGSDGTISHVFNSGSSRYSGDNLIAKYGKVMITEEAVGSDPDQPVGQVVFSHQINASANKQIRQLLSDDGSGAGSLTQLKAQLTVALGHSSLANNQSNSIAQIKTHLESVVNAIEGPSGSNYGDLDGNGTIASAGDGVGALVHAANSSSAGSLAASGAVDESITTHSALVGTNIGNSIDFAKLAVSEALVAVNKTDVNTARIYAARINGLVQDALDGVDTNRDGAVSSVSGEGAADRAYLEAQLMATYTLDNGVVPTPAPELPKAGDEMLPLMAQMSILAGFVLLVVGGSLVMSVRLARRRVDR